MVARFASIKMAGVVNDNWQTELPSIEERTMFIFNKELMSDVKFVFTEANDDGSKKAKLAIPAHKFTSLFLVSAVLCFMPCSMVQWRKLKIPLNYLTVITRVC